MEKTERVKCPYCGAILKLKNINIPGIERKRLVCPVCKESVLFSEFILLQNNVSEPTDYTDTDYTNRRRPDDEKTIYWTQYNRDNPINCKIGKLKLKSEGLEYPLKEGRNIIGRQASTSSATIQIPTNNNRRMSREHLVIDVQRSGSSEFKHVASLYKESTNVTFINNEVLEYGDNVILNDGDVIRLPEVAIIFENR